MAPSQIFFVPHKNERKDALRNKARATLFWSAGRAAVRLKHTAVYQIPLQQGWSKTIELDSSQKWMLVIVFYFDFTVLRYVSKKKTKNTNSRTGEKLKQENVMHTPAPPLYLFPSFDFDGDGLGPGTLE